MEENKENLNPLSIDGYLGRKYYFLIGLVIAIVLSAMQFLFCRSVFQAIMENSVSGISTNMISIIKTASDGHLIVWLILVSLGCFLSFINNTKRLYDISGDRQRSFITAISVVVLTLSMYFIPVKSTAYGLLSLALSAVGFAMLLIPGKFSVREKEAVVTKETIHSNEVVEASAAVVFWKRIGAYYIDTLIVLKIAGLLIGTVGASLWYEIAGYGILAGAVVYLLYFGLMNSVLCGGQTIGKKLFAINVVDKNNEFISVGKSFLRAFIFVVCVYAVGAFSSALVTVMPEYHIFDIKNIFPLTVLLFLYLVFVLIFIFNKNRQTLHDFPVKSFVTSKENTKILYAEKTDITIIIVSVIIALIFSAPMLAGSFAAKNIIKQKTVFPDKLADEMHLDVFSYAQYGSEENKNLGIVVRTKDIDNQALADKVGNYILLNSAYASSSKNINVTLKNNYNIGIYKSSKSKYYKIK